MRLLFVCSRNRLRSPTAEAVCCDWEGYEAASAGTATDAETRVSLDLIEWADVVVAMEAIHKKRLQAMFPAAMRAKRLVVLGIRDRYTFMQPELVALLREKLTRLWPELALSKTVADPLMHPRV